MYKCVCGIDVHKQQRNSLNIRTWWLFVCLFDISVQVSCVVCVQVYVASKAGRVCYVCNNL
jgi:hypothetical protein